MSSNTKFEVVLIWSHAPVSEINKTIDKRSAYAFNRVFDERPDIQKLGGLIAEKQKDLDAKPSVYPDPRFHELQVREVITEVLDLEHVISHYNAASE